MPHTIEMIHSELLQAEIPFAVILPDSDGPFPVLYDLHGLLSDEGPYDPRPTERSYFEKQPFRKLQSIADEAGTAIVRVNGGRGWYLDSSRIENSQYESHIVHELFQAVENMFPMSGKRGISGHSMGGMGAVNLLCRHPEMFSIGAIHCASLRFMPGDHRGSYIEDLMSDDELRAAFPPNFLNAMIRDDLALRITVGADDKERIVRENRTLHQFLVEHNMAHHYEETPGGHEYIPHGLNGVIWAAKTLGEQAYGS